MAVYEIIFVDIDFNEYSYVIESKHLTEAKDEATRKFNFEHPEIKPDEIYDIVVYLCDRK